MSVYKTCLAIKSSGICWAEMPHSDRAVKRREIILGLWGVSSTTFFFLWWVSPTPSGISFSQFNSRIGVLVHLTFANDYICSEGFQQQFSIISKFVCCGFYMKKNVDFTLISFAVLKWDDCLSVQLPFDLPVQMPVQLLLELEPNLLVQNLIELEFELSRM